MNLGMRLICGVRCTVCGQYYANPEADQRRLEVVLFGAKQICPLCGLDYAGQATRNRALRFINEHLQKKQAKVLETGEITRIEWVTWTQMCLRVAGKLTVYKLRDLAGKIELL